MTPMLKPMRMRPFVIDRMKLKTYADRLEELDLTFFLLPWWSVILPPLMANIKNVDGHDSGEEAYARPRKWTKDD